MSSSAIIAIAIAAAVVLAALAFVTTARRTDVRGAGALAAETRKRDTDARAARAEVEAAATRDAAPATASRAEVEAAGVVARTGTLVRAEPKELVPFVAPDPEAIGVSRRQFFNRASVSLTTAGIGAFAAAGFVAFLWPTATGGFGQNVNVGRLQDIRDGARANNGFFYAPAARAWLTEYPVAAVPEAQSTYPANIFSGIEQFGLVALYQKCPHLGCRVPECATSRWFECGCHGSQYNQVGEKKGGPAPRGMDLFPITVDGGGNVTVQTGTIVTGMAIGTNTTGQEAEGPHCVGAAGGH